jgi:hypothetical protein
MDNVSSNPNHSDNLNDPIPPNDGVAEPARPAAIPAGASPGVSRAPLNLGGGTATPVAPAAPKPPVVRPVPPKPPTSVGVSVAPVGRITACKTFFTKMHPGAIHFLDEQIAKWLKEDPSVVIKSINVLQGEITEKKIEPNIIIVVWY